MKKRDNLGNVIFLLILITSFVFILSIVSGEGSDTTSSDEWLMFGRNLNHNSWDGVNFSVISGLNNVSFTTGNIIRSSPIVIGRYVYIGSWDNRLYQLNASNVSQHIANFTTGDVIHLSSFAVANGYVYFGGADNKFYQLNASNVSQHIANFTTGGDIDNSPVIANGYVYFGGRDNFLYQLNASNVSQQIVNFTTGTQFESSPALAYGYLYIGSTDDHMYQLNASNVSQHIANFTTGGDIASSPAVANGYVYVGSLDKKLYQLNASNVSQHIANFTIPLDQIDSSPAVANGYVYFGGRDNCSYQLNASNVSQHIANFTTGGDIASSPAVANGYVYVGSLDKKLYQLNASNVSQHIANFTTGSFIFSSPAVANGYVYIGSDDNKFYQLNASNIGLSNNFLDTTPPNINIISPANSTSTSNNKINVNYTVSDTNLQSCWYSNDTFTYNYSLTCGNNITGITWADGAHNVKVYANDSSGNENSSSVTFTISCTESWSCTDWSSCSGSEQTRTCTDANSCGTTASKPAETQSCTSGGGGGGSSSSGSGTPSVIIVPPATTPSEAPTADAIPTTEIIITNPNVDVTKITISPLEGIEGEIVTVQPEVPPTAAEVLASAEGAQAQGESYQAFSINLNKTKNKKIAKAKIDFKVNQSWLEQRQKTADNIRLFRKNPKSEKWDILPTFYEKSENRSYYFTAETPGFSTFVIFLGEYECTPNTRRCFENTVQFCVGDSTWLVTEKCNKCVDGECKPTLFTPIIISTWIIAFFLIFALIASYAAVRKGQSKREKHNFEKIPRLS